MNILFVGKARAVSVWADEMEKLYGGCTVVEFLKDRERHENAKKAIITAARNNKQITSGGTL